VGARATADDVAALEKPPTAAGADAEENAPPPYTDQLF
jgi:hypothetical protein